MKSKSFMLMILSMGFGLIAAIGISQVMRTSKANTQPVTKMGPVLVAADHLDMKARLTEENVKIENWPVSIIPENAVTKLEDIKEMITRTRMSKGMPIVGSAIINEKEANIISIPDGFKVVAIKVAADDTISGLLNPGDKVDIMGFFKIRSRGETQTVARTFMKAIRVFSVNNKMQAAQNRQEAGGARGAIVGVLATEKQSEEIFYAQKTGTIKLVLRGEESVSDGDVESIEDIMAIDENLAMETESEEQVQQAFPMPAHFGTAEYSTIVWKGNSPEKVTFQGNGLLPQRSGDNVPPPGHSRNSDGPEGPEDLEEFDGNDEIDRKLDQDQYRGE